MSEELYRFGRDVPIVPSLLWTDEYKLTTSQLAWKLHRDVPVTFSLINRTKSVGLAELIPEERLREELDRVLTLRFTIEDRQKLEKMVGRSGKPLFMTEFLDYLEKMRLPEYKLRVVDGQYDLKFAGDWPTVTHWEIPALSIVTTLANEYRLRQMGGLVAWFRSRVTGYERLSGKLSTLEVYPEVRFTEFGCRRADSPYWNDLVYEGCVETLKDGQLLGTSNVYLGHKYNTPIRGTLPHEIHMVYSGIMHGSDDSIRASHNKVYYDWESIYGLDKSIFLPDIYGSQFAFRELPKEMVCSWDGFRWDSGNVYDFGEEEISLYSRYGIDPKEKVLLPSDGLTLATMIGVVIRFRNRIQCMFGWGSNLTNDVGLDNLSLVVKVVESNGHGTVKLSDNLAKALGKPEDIERYKRIFGYTSNFSQSCRY